MHLASLATAPARATQTLSVASWGPHPGALTQALTCSDSSRSQVVQCTYGQRPVWPTGTSSSSPSWRMQWGPVKVHMPGSGCMWRLHRRGLLEASFPKSVLPLHLQLMAGTIVKIETGRGSSSPARPVLAFQNIHEVSVEPTPSNDAVDATQSERPAAAWSWNLAGAGQSYS